MRTKKVFIVGSVAALMAFATAASVSAAEFPLVKSPLTCTKQFGKCFKACVKAANSKAFCNRGCGGLHTSCMSNTCWNGPRFKACGLTKR